MTYRTGQVARLLNVSAHHIRRLCEAGLVKGEMSEGNRWKIAASEVDRLRADGVPPIPQIEDEQCERPAPAGSGSGTGPTGRQLHPWPADPPAAPEPEEVAPEVQEERNNYAVVETKLKRRRVELELDEVEDSFRDRERRRIAEIEDGRRKEAQAQAQAARSEWVDRWIAYALSRVPDDAGGCRMEAYRMAEKALRTITADVSDSVVRRFMDDAVSEALAPYRRRREVEKAVQSAVDGLLPYSARSSRVGVEAKRAAQQAAERFTDEASMLVAARAAVAPIAAAFKDAEVRQAILQLGSYWGMSYGATDTDREQAVAAVSEALEDLPAGTPQDRLEKAARAALAPLEAALQERHERKQRRAAAETAADQRLWLVHYFLAENCDFDSYAEQKETEEELKAELRQVLVKRLLSGRLAASDVSDFVEEWLNDWLEDDDEDDEDDDE